jgi:hypothetical protein
MVTVADIFGGSNRDDGNTADVLKHGDIFHLRGKRIAGRAHHAESLGHRGSALDQASVEGRSERSNVEQAERLYRRVVSRVTFRSDQSLKFLELTDALAGRVLEGRAQRRKPYPCFMPARGSGLKPSEFLELH